MKLDSEYRNALGGDRLRESNAALCFSASAG